MRHSPVLIRLSTFLYSPVSDGVDRRCVCYIHSEIRLALFVLGVICFFLLICFIVAYSSLGSARAVVVLEKYMYGEGIFVSGIFVAGSLFVSGVLLRQHWVRCSFLDNLFIPCLIHPLTSCICCFVAEQLGPSRVPESPLAHFAHGPRVRFGISVGLDFVS
jgi:hypothetical protein